MSRKFILIKQLLLLYVFFFNDTATTEIYTLSLHDALPISWRSSASGWSGSLTCRSSPPRRRSEEHTSELHHPSISYAVFCLKKKKKYKSPVLYKKKKKQNNQRNNKNQKN